MAAGWPLVGRGEQLEAIADARRAPTLRGALLVGPAGVGKTRLADAALEAAARDGLPTGRAAASVAAAATPFGAVAHLLPADVAGAAADPVGLFAAVAEGLAAAGASPFVVLVDDVPLLDATSVTLVGQLLDAGGVFLLGTVREDEVHRRAFEPLARRDDLLRIELGPLARADLDTTLHLALGGPATASTLTACWNVSQGNPLVLRELVVAARAAGHLEQHQGSWTLTGPLPTTGRLREVVDSRLASLSPAARKALELVALVQPVGLAEVEEAAGPAVLDELDRAGLVALRTDRRRQELSTVHPLYGEVLRDALPPLTRRRLLLDDAMRIEAHGARRREDPLRVATARLDATGSADADLLVAAARLARYGHDFPEVARLATAARSDAAPAEAALLLGEALHELGRYPEADEVLRPAAADARPHDRVWVQVVAMHVRNLVWGLQRPDDALAVVRATQAEDLDEASRDELRTDHALVQLFSGRPADALAILREVPRDRPRTACLAAITEVPSLITTGRCETGRAAAERAYDERLALGDQAAISPAGVHVLYQVHALTELGRLADAVELASIARLAAGEGGPPDARMWFVFNLGRATLLTGRVGEAARWFAEATAASHDAGLDGPRRFVLSLLATARAWAGDHAGAGDAVAAMEDLPPFAFVGQEQALGPAWSVAATDPQRARDILLEAAAEAAEREHRTSEAWLLHDVARLGDPGVVADRLDELARTVEGDLVAARAAHARAAAADDAGGLTAAGAAFEQLGALLFAAEAATAAAHAHQRRGQQREAAAQRSRAADLARRCEGVATPGLVTAEAVVPLTAREREIATLAAERWSSREIAERLYLSARTVDNHLQRAYTKLGVSSRGELAEVLRTLSSEEG